MGARRAARNQAEREAEATRRRVGNAARAAFETLGLDHETSADDIRRRYKDLVKRHHPDANGGDRSHEDRLRDIIQAYATLKAAGFTKKA